MTDKWKTLVAAAAICICGIMLPQQIMAAALSAENEVQQEQFFVQSSEDSRIQQEAEAEAETDADITPVEESNYKKAGPNTILPAPDSLKADKVAYNAVTLSWSEVEGAAGYQIEYSTNGTEYTVAGKASANTLTYKCKKLLTGTKYQIRVCALDQNNKAGNYISITAKPYLKKPKITNTAVSQLHAVTLEWKKVSGAEKYELYRKEKGGAAYQLIKTVTEQVYTDETVAASQIYLYQVRAVRNVNQQAVSSKLSAAVEVVIAMPAVQIETCEAINHYSVKLTWQGADSVTGYYIYRSVKETGTYKKIKTITKNTTLSYTDTGVVPGKAFYYKVCAYVQAQDQSILTGEQSVAKMAETQMQAPNLTGVNMNDSNRSLALSWEKITDATGYRVFRSQYPDKKFVKITDVASGIAIGYEDRSVAPGGTYYYRIMALYENKNYKGKSLTSNVRQGNVAPSAPIGLKIQQTATDVLNISWNKSVGASTYNLYRANTGSGTYTCIAKGLAATDYTDQELKDNQTYFYRVSAVGTGGEGRKCLPLSYLVGGVSMNTRILKVCVGVSKPLEISTYRQGKVVWKSADPKIAEVDSAGMVTGIAYGTVNVTATVAGKSAAATVSVTPGIKNGMDVSRWQEDIDWRRVQDSGIDFAFLRISNHYLEDYTFETKYQDASSIGMPLGVYCYSRATTVAEAQEEARTILQILNGRKLDYPIAFDMEDAVHKSESMTKETLHQMILAFKDVVEDAGYRFVLYSYLTFLNTNLDKMKLEGIDLWIARYRSVLLGPGYTGTGNVKYWQYNSGQYSGSDFHVDGITDAAGNLAEVDVNIEYEMQQ